MLKTIKLAIIFLLAFFVVGIFSVLSGIKINSISLGGFSVSQLYIKLDKKLILEIDEIIIESKQSNVKNSSDDLLKNITKLPHVLKLFQKIDIENLQIKDNHFTITLDEEHLYLDNKYVNLAAHMDYNEPQVNLDIHSLFLKDIDLTLMGKSNIDLASKSMNFFGTYLHKKTIEGELDFKVDEELLDFHVNTTKSIKSLKFLKGFFRLDKVAEAWMYDYVKGDISLKYLNGKIDLVKKEAILDSIKGKALISNAKIQFHKDAKSVNTKLLELTYEDDRLSFDLEKPTYNKSKLYGSRVYISNLTSLQKGTVVVDLKSKSMLNSDILGILNAFEINLPLRQESGKLDSKLVLKIPYLASKKMEVDGIFKLKDAKLWLNDFDFFVNSAHVTLKDNLVKIRKSNMKHQDMLDANLDLDINTNSLTASGKAKINRFKVQTKDSNIVDIKDYDTKVEVDFKKDTIIKLADLKTQIDIFDTNILINLADLSLVYPYSNVLKEAEVTKGDLDINYIDENFIKFSSNIKQINMPFAKDGKNITTLKIKGEIKGNDTFISNDDNSIQIFSKNGESLIKLDKIDLVLNKNSKKKEEKTKFPDLKISLKDSKIKIDEKNIYKAAWAKIDIKNNIVNFEGKALNLDLPISRKGKEVKDLVVVGKYANDFIHIKTKDTKLKLKYDIKKDKLHMDLNGYDVLYDTNIEEDEGSVTAYYINGINSNIIMNKKYVARASTYKFVFENHKTTIDLKYANTKFNYLKDFAGNITVEAKNMNDVFLNALLGKNLIKGGSVNLSATGFKNVLNGKAYLKDTNIADLAILNNLITFINTSPGLINPLLAIPSVVGMASKDGFNLTGYKVTEGSVDFTYDSNKKFLNMSKIFTKGNGIDFDGYATLDFEKSTVNSKLKLIFFKDYAKIVGAIPVLNYVLLGDEKRVSTNVEIYGSLEKPQYKTKVVEDGAKAPVNVIKRIITSPVKLLESIGDTLKGK